MMYFHEEGQCSSGWESRDARECGASHVLLHLHPLTSGRRMTRRDDTSLSVEDAQSDRNSEKEIKTESTRKSNNIYLSWTKIEYQNNLNPIALFSTLNKR